ncbi:hypothetical protein GQ473_01405 [archaeon]|nr:hypothetical protein [archaeon]
MFKNNFFVFSRLFVVIIFSLILFNPLSFAVEISAAPCGFYGDLNGDGQINDVDATMISEYVAGSRDFTTNQVVRADLNENGRVDIGDVSAIAYFVAGNIDTFSICSSLKKAPCESYGDVDGDGYVTDIDSDFLSTTLANNYAHKTFYIDETTVLNGQTIQVIAIGSDVVAVKIGTTSKIIKDTDGDVSIGLTGIIVNVETISYDDDVTKRFTILNIKQFDNIFTNSHELRSDLNENNRIDIGDVAAVAYFVAGTIDSFDICDSKETQLICDDSDMGLNYGLKGGVLSKFHDSVMYDQCLINIVTGKSDGLSEMYCDDNTYEKWNHITVKCLNGCSDGACIDNEYMTPNCIDDDKEDIYVAGIAQNEYGTGQNDCCVVNENGGSCVSKSNYLREGVCKENYNITEWSFTSKIFKCPNGCDNGACIEDTTPESIVDEPICGNNLCDDGESPRECPDDCGEYQELFDEENCTTWHAPNVFNYAPCGNEKIYDVISKDTIKISAYADGCDSCVCYHVAFDVYDYVENSWVLKKSVAEPDEKGTKNIFDFSPKGSKIKIVGKNKCFHLNVYTLSFSDTNNTDEEIVNNTIETHNAYIYNVVYDSNNNVYSFDIKYYLSILDITESELMNDSFLNLEVKIGNDVVSIVPEPSATSNAYILISPLNKNKNSTKIIATYRGNLKTVVIEKDLEKIKNCPEQRCENDCKSGFKEDVDGCPICSCKDNDENEDNLRTEINPEKETFCSGCLTENGCMVQGTRTTVANISLYCNIENNLALQKKDDKSCHNNFECKSNFCSNDVCLDINKQIQENSNILQRILAFLTDFFSF